MTHNTSRHWENMTFGRQVPWSSRSHLLGVRATAKIHRKHHGSHLQESEDWIQKWFTYRWITCWRDSRKSLVKRFGDNSAIMLNDKDNRLFSTTDLKLVSGWIQTSVELQALQFQPEKWEWQVQGNPSWQWNFQTKTSKRDFKKPPKPRHK